MNWRERLADWITGGELTRARELNWVGFQEAGRYWVALQSIASNTCCDGCQEAARVAQAAIREAGKA